ncbi:conserved protein of unknown function [[Clostridium] ultunense Esp]|uniref:Uncharacterized protein n=1 Tax=[Clostridium] ultunense Esp TaxID=1288971 RepID=A0A1M4PM41_9FIRM|nr:conserved protein of unknown function [[Clostridium] ultunense Esp]
MECILGLTTLENDKIKSIFLDYIVTVDFMRRKDAHEYLTHTPNINSLKYESLFAIINNIGI